MVKRLVFCTFWRDVSLVQGEKFPPVNCKVPGSKQVALMGLKKDPVFSLIPPFFLKVGKVGLEFKIKAG